MHASTARKSTPAAAASERREDERHTMVLRVGIIDDGTKASICLVRNISPRGVQVKAYSQMTIGAQVTLRVGDEDPIAGRLLWYRDRIAGIQFEEELEAGTLLRVKQQGGLARRRSAPRVALDGFALLRAGGQTYSAKLCDISTSGAKIRTSRPVSAAGAAVLEVPDMPPLQAFVRWVDGSDLGLSFAIPLPIEIIACWIGERSLRVAG